MVTDFNFEHWMEVSHETISTAFSIHDSSKGVITDFTRLRIRLKNAVFWDVTPYGSCNN
jgi:hypothetical protein